MLNCYLDYNDETSLVEYAKVDNFAQRHDALWALAKEIIHTNGHPYRTQIGDLWDYLDRESAWWASYQVAKHQKKDLTNTSLFVDAWYVMIRIQKEFGAW